MRGSRPGYGSTHPDLIRLLATLTPAATERVTWPRHVLNVALNAAGGGVLLAIGEPTRAAVSTGIGIAFGELYIWTQPDGADEDWDAYRKRFDSGAELSFNVTPGGLAFEMRF
jgi:hypothetical protein